MRRCRRVRAGRDEGGSSAPGSDIRSSVPTRTAESRDPLRPLLLAPLTGRSGHGRATHRCIREALAHFRRALLAVVCDPMDADQILALTDQLLAEHDPADRIDFRGAQYDLGLAWVHFPEGFGGLGADAKLQRVVEDRLRGAGVKYTEIGWNGFGLFLAAPDDRRARAAGDEGPPAPSAVHRRGDLVPAVQRARRRERPRVARDPGRARRRRVGRQRPEGVEHARAHGRPRDARRPHRPRRAQAPRASPTSRSTCTRRASRCGRCGRSPARPSSTRST